MTGTSPQRGSKRDADGTAKKRFPAAEKKRGISGNRVVGISLYSGDGRGTDADAVPSYSEGVPDSQ